VRAVSGVRQAWDGDPVVGRWGDAAGVTHRHDLLLAGVDDADLLVLAGGDEEAAGAVPAHVVDEVGVDVLQRQQHLPRAHVPEDHQVVAACRGPTGRTPSPHGPPQPRGG